MIGTAPATANWQSPSTSLAMVAPVRDISCMMTSRPASSKKPEATPSAIGAFPAPWAE
jgi:hypothetical protein